MLSPLLGAKSFSPFGSAGLSIPGVSIISPFLTGIGTAWTGSTLPLNGTDSMSVVTTAPALVGDVLRFAAGQYLELDLTDNLDGKTIVITQKVTATSIASAATISFVSDRAGDYVSLEAKTAGKFEGRFKDQDMGFDFDTSPINLLQAIPNTLNSVATYVMRFLDGKVVMTLNGEAMNFVPLDNNVPNTRGVTKLLIGASGHGGRYSPAWDLYRFDVLNSTDPADIEALTASHAAYGTAQAVESVFMAERVIHVGHSVTQGVVIAGKGFAHQVRESLKTAVFWNKQADYTPGGGQMSPLGLTGQEPQLSHCFPNITADVTALTDTFGLFLDHGLNDWYSNVPIGTPLSLDVNTFLGAMNVGLTNCFNNGIRVVGNIPFYYEGEDTPNANGDVLNDFRAALIANYDAWGVPYANVYEALDINAANIVSMTDVTKHPNQAYHDAAAPIVLEVMRQGGAVPVTP